MVFSRILLFPLLMIQKKSENVSHSVVSDSLRPPWTVACQVPLSMKFSRQEYWSRLPFLSWGNLPSPGIKPQFPALKTDSLWSESPGKLLMICLFFKLINLFLLEGNYFIIFWWLLPYIDMNQSWVYMCPTILNPSHLLPHTSPLGCPRVPALSSLRHALNLH